MRSRRPVPARPAIPAHPHPQALPTYTSSKPSHLSRFRFPPPPTTRQILLLFALALLFITFLRFFRTAPPPLSLTTPYAYQEDLLPTLRRKHPQHHHRYHPQHHFPRDGTVLFIETAFNGLGAQSLRLLDALSVADALHANLLPQPARYWNYGCAPYRAWACYFLPFPHASSSPVDSSLCKELSDLPSPPSAFSSPAATRTALGLPAGPDLCVKISTGDSADRATEFFLRQAHFEPPAQETQTQVRLPLAKALHLRPSDLTAKPWNVGKGRAPLDDALSRGSNAATLPHARRLARRIWRLAPSTKKRVEARLRSAGVVWESHVSGSGGEKRRRMVLKEAARGAGKGSRFVGVHLRRGDKRSEVRAVEIVKYMRAIDSVSPPGTAVFVSSDDGRALEKMRKVLEEAGRPVLSLGTAVHRTGHHQAASNRFPVKKNRPRVEALLAEIHALAHADWFVGTFSSNMGRLVHALRDGFEAETSISVDHRWAAGVAFRTFGTNYCAADDANQKFCKAEMERILTRKTKGRTKKHV